MIQFCCPKCGETLSQGEYFYDEETDIMRVDHCPCCECDYGDPCDIFGDED